MEWQSSFLCTCRNKHTTFIWRVNAHAYKCNARPCALCLQVKFNCFFSFISTRHLDRDEGCQNKKIKAAQTHTQWLCFTSSRLCMESVMWKEHSVGIPNTLIKQTPKAYWLEQEACCVKWDFTERKAACLQNKPPLHVTLTVLEWSSLKERKKCSMQTS